MFDFLAFIIETRVTRYKHTPCAGNAAQYLSRAQSVFFLRSPPDEASLGENRFYTTERSEREVRTGINISNWNRNIVLDKRSFRLAIEAAGPPDPACLTKGSVFSIGHV